MANIPSSYYPSTQNSFPVQFTSGLESVQPTGLPSGQTEHIILKSGNTLIELERGRLLVEWLEHVVKQQLLTKDSEGRGFLFIKQESSDLLSLVQKSLYLMQSIAAINSKYERVKAAYHEFTNLIFSLEQSMQLLNLLDELKATRNVISGLVWRCAQLSEGKDVRFSKLNVNLQSEFNRYFILLYSKPLAGAPATTFHLQHLLDFNKLEKAKVFPQPGHLNLERCHISHIDTLDFLCRKYDVDLDSLVSINLSLNEIQEFPDDLLTRCTQLKVFYANDNKIKQIASIFFENCKKLEFFDIRNNPIKTLTGTVFSVRKVHADVRLLGDSSSIDKKSVEFRGDLHNDAKKLIFYFQAFRPIVVEDFNHIFVEEQLNSVSFTPDSHRIFMLTTDHSPPRNRGILIDTITGAIYKLTHEDCSPIDGWDSAENGKVFITFSKDRNVLHFHYLDMLGKVRAEKTLTIKYDSVVQKGHRDEVVTPIGLRLARLSHDGKKVAVCPNEMIPSSYRRPDYLPPAAGDMGFQLEYLNMLENCGDQARFYDLESNKNYTISHREKIVSIDFSPDNKKAITVSKNMVKILILTSGAILEIPQKEIIVAKFNFDGTSITMLCKDGSLTRINSEPPLVISRDTFWGLSGDYRFREFLSSENSLVVEDEGWGGHFGPTPIKTIDISVLLGVSPITKKIITLLDNKIKMLEIIPIQEGRHSDGTFEVEERSAGVLDSPSCHRAYMSPDGTKIFAISRQNHGISIGTADQFSIWNIPELSDAQRSALDELYKLSKSSVNIGSEQQLAHLNAELKKIPRFLGNSKK